ncbi:MAG: site-specific integrase, partial [Muribaculaceae bacterium]|nr:site-specific integrase [Muribaculaceae bacterium]
MAAAVSLLDRYAAWLLLERGLSANTRLAYMADASRLETWLADHGSGIAEADTDTLRAFLADIHDLGISARSQARVISGIKSLYRFLRLERVVEENPS